MYEGGILMLPIRWSLLSEYFSLVILTIIFTRCYGYERHVALNARRKLFLYCLLAAIGSIVLNIITVFTISSPGCIPLWLAILLNSGYFFLTLATCSLFAWFLFSLTLEHVYDKHCMQRAKVILTTIIVISFLVVALNLFTGILFYFDEAGEYQRGPLNRAVYFFPLAELFLLFICYRKNRSSVSNSMVYVIRSLPPIVLSLCLAQVIFPDFLLNGALSAIVSLVLFISFQTHTNERDSLTDIRNRDNFMTDMSLRIAGHQQTHIILLSLLSFADINMRYGHAFGDAVLYEVARYLDRLYPDGRAFRTSNMNFVLTLPWNSSAQAEKELEAVQGRMELPWVLGDKSCTLSFCIVDMHCESTATDTISNLVERLEFALAQAKKSHSVVRYDKELDRQLWRRKDLIEILQRSIKEHRFSIWYQPIYCCHRNIFCSAEALLRLNDYSGIPISPEDFIPLAEEYGLIGDLTWMVLEDICRLLGSNHVPGLESVSINLSLQEFLDPNLASRLQEYLTIYHVDPKRLKIEVTERFLLHDAAHAQQQFAALEAIGIELYMDDFGTGYSNLSCVLDYPFNFIKVDRSLVQHAPEDQRANQMISSLTSLFHTLDKKLIMEGVETEAQAEYIKHCGADMIQGFYYAKPMSRDDLISFFQEQSNKPE